MGIRLLLLGRRCVIVPGLVTLARARHAPHALMVAIPAAVLDVHPLVGPVLLASALLAPGEARGPQIYRRASEGAG